MKDTTLSPQSPVLSTVHPPRARLSVVIITKNEEHRIARCLSSVRWADEIVVVDGMSTDRTVAMCRAYGARIISHAFEDDFSIERNLGIEGATGEWVLQLDADDVVTDEFRRHVLQLLVNDDPAYDAYKFRRKSVLLGQPMRYGGWLYYIPNLVRRRTVRYTGRVHERPVVPGKTGVVEADIEHHPFATLDEFFQTHRRYAGLQAHELLDREGRLPLWRVRWRMVHRPWKSWWKSYVKKQGFREGWNGLRFSVLFAWVEWLKWRTYQKLCAVQDAGSKMQDTRHNTERDE